MSSGTAALVTTLYVTAHVPTRLVGGAVALSSDRGHRHRVGQTEKGLVVLAVLGLLGLIGLWLATRELEPATVNGVPASAP